MAGVTDIAFRELCEEMGASYTCSELMPVEGLARGKVPRSLYERRNLRINCIQLFGSVSESFSKAVEAIRDEADIIDINFGCPAYTLTSRNCGSVLLKDPGSVGKIVSAAVKMSGAPVTAKIRLGYKQKNYLDIAREIEQAGAEAITLHARTAEQKYSGRADWQAIKALYEQSGILIIGNGDIKSEEDIDRYLGTYADGLMVGRAAMGNPAIFKSFCHYFRTGELLEREGKEYQKKLFAKYLDKLKGTEILGDLVRLRLQATWFFRGFNGSKDLRVKILSSESLSEVLDHVENF